jgi:hypothetical protein
VHVRGCGSVCQCPFLILMSAVDSFLVFSALVRSLVRFVKDRDPRCVACVCPASRAIVDCQLLAVTIDCMHIFRVARIAIAKAKAAQLRKAEEDERKKKQDSERKLQREAHLELERLRLEQQRAEHKAKYGNSESEESEQESAEVLECAPCRKRFRSQNAWLDHKKSKKHLQAMALLGRDFFRGSLDL